MLRRDQVSFDGLDWMRTIDDDGRTKSAKTTSGIKLSFLFVCLFVIFVCFFCLKRGASNCRQNIMASDS